MIRKYCVRDLVLDQRFSMQLQHISQLRIMVKTKHTSSVVDAKGRSNFIRNTETSQMHLNFGQ